MTWRSVTGAALVVCLAGLANCPAAEEKPDGRMLAEALKGVSGDLLEIDGKPATQEQLKDALPVSGARSVPPVAP